MVKETWFQGTRGTPLASRANALIRREEDKKMPGRQKRVFSRCRSFKKDLIFRENIRTMAHFASYFIRHATNIALIICLLTRIVLSLSVEICKWISPSADNQKYFVQAT